MGIQNSGDSGYKPYGIAFKLDKKGELTQLL